MKVKKLIQGIILPLGIMASFNASADSPNVINGIEISDDKIPSVFMLPNGCTATFVGPKVFLTSAHCVHSNTVSIEGIEAKMRKHPDYNPSRFYDRTYVDYYDIAIGVLEESLSDMRTAEPASLCPVSPNENLLDKKALLVGYGCNSWPWRTGGGVKRYGYSFISKIDKDFLQTKTEENGGLSCPGDSGAPYFVVNEDFSICYVSTNFHSDRTTYNRSTNVFHPPVKKWIEDVAKETNTDICGVNANCDTRLVPASMR